jgi:IS4 transposase
MVFAHFNELKSLRTLEIAINSQQIGLACKARRSTLSDANRMRPAECFFWILQQLMFLLPRKMRKNVNKVVKLLDSTPIKLKGTGYDEWIKQYATAHWQGLKLHVEFDLELESPTKVAVSYANYNDSSMGQRWPITPDIIYVFDKGYCDYNWWWSIEQKQAFFVTRLKNNAAVTMESEKKIVSEIILEDTTFKFKNKQPRGGKKNLYIRSLRRIVVKREGKSPLILVTNLLDVPSEIIASLYKNRWEIELFFKWIKQNLRIKKFLGMSANAVKIQLATALITYVLIQLLKNNSKDQKSLQHILVWIRFNFYRQVPPRIRHGDPPIYLIPKQRLLINREGVYL